MEGLITVLVYGIVIYSVVRAIRKKKGLTTPGLKELKNNKPVKYDTFNKKGKFHSKESGSMPHSHKQEKYVSMADASNLPKGYILLNGEPVRVADLEDK
jgi:hypothetical protein